MKSLIVLGAFVAVMGGVLAYGHFFQITGADRSGLGQACAKWISEDFSDGRPTEISDVWRKNGKFVFEVLAQQATGSSKRVMLCVVDKKDGTVMRPGLASYQDWKK